MGHIWQMAQNIGGIMKCPKRLFMNFISTEWSFCGKQGADLLLLETQPSLREALVEAKIAEEMGADYWISFSCGDDKHINEGTKIAECARAFSRGSP